MKQLMHQNDIILEFDLKKGIFDVKKNELLPIELRNNFLQYKTNSSMEERDYIRDNNKQIFSSFLARRVLPLSRSNAKKILNAFSLSQSQDEQTKIDIALSCRAISVTDDYWVKEETDKTKWENVNPRTNSLNKIVTLVSLSGKSLTLTGKPKTPDITGQGAYAKSWVRLHGDLYLLKANTFSGKESELEDSVSKILDCFNVPHVQYHCLNFEGKTVSKCKNMTNDFFGMVSAEDFYIHCQRQGKNFIQESLSIDAENIWKMCIVDYLISNSDRHLGNWGFYMDKKTGELVSCHLLYDHNNAFDQEQMEDKQGGGSLVFEGKTKQEVAKVAIKKCNFVCTKPLSKNMFLNKKMYHSFVERCVELGLYKEKEQTFFEKLLKKEKEYIPTKIEKNIIKMPQKYYDTIQNFTKNNKEQTLDELIQSFTKPENNKNLTYDDLER